jgi:hypothetical protein
MIRLDIDANKSLHLHTAGNSGKCIFRPVVFVDIEEGPHIRTCPNAVAGSIVGITYDASGQPVQFSMERTANGDIINVILLPDVVVFDGDFQDPAVLAVGQDVQVVGKLNNNLSLQASVVVIGSVLDVKGDVDSSVQFIDSLQTIGTFQFTPFAGEQIVGQVDVEIVRDKTFILMDCNTRLQPEDIMAGMTARVISKYIAGQDVFRAVAVFLKPKEISGTLLSWDYAVNGRDLVLNVDGITITVPQLTEPGFPSNTFYPVYLDQDGLVPLNLLCSGSSGIRKVRVILDPDVLSPLTAREVRVVSEPTDGFNAVVVQNNAPVLVMDNAQDVYVLPGATILDQRPGGTTLSPEEILPGLNVIYYGLNSCPSNTTADFYAFILQVVPLVP